MQVEHAAAEAMSHVPVVIRVSPLRRTPRMAGHGQSRGADRTEEDEEASDALSMRIQMKGRTEAVKRAAAQLAKKERERLLAAEAED